MLLKRNQTYSRFWLEDPKVFEAPGWRDLLRAQLEERAFVERPSSTDAVRTGFVDPWHLSTVTFEDHTRWIFEPHVVVGFRIDKKSVPSNLFNAELQRKISAWCAERGVERCPSAVRSEIREDLKEQWMARAIPKVKHLQIGVDTGTGTVRIFGTLSDVDSDLVRKAFFRAFGTRLYPFGFRPDEEPKNEKDALLVDAIRLGPLRPRSGETQESP